MGRCLQTLLLCLRPALGPSFKPLLFSSQTRKNENTARGAPTSWRLCQLTSGHGAAAGAHSGQGSSTFLTPSPHFTGDREPCVQRKGPSSTDCQSRLGPSSPKMVRQDFILSAEEPQAGLSGRDGAGGRLWVASQIRLCSLKLAAPPGKGFRPELFIELCGGSLAIELSGSFLSSLSTFKTSREMVT